MDNSVHFNNGIRGIGNHCQIVSVGLAAITTRILSLSKTYALKY